MSGTRAAAGSNRYMINFTWTDDAHLVPVTDAEMMPAESADEARQKLVDVYTAESKTLVKVLNIQNTGSPITIL